MRKKYHFKTLTWLIKDEQSTRFHIKQDDYFGTIATILSLIKQKLKKSQTKYSSDFYNTLNDLEKDLLWLQKNYQITPKIKKKNKTPKGKDISQ